MGGGGGPSTEEVVLGVRFLVGTGFTKGRSTAKMISGFDPMPRPHGIPDSTQLDS